MRVDPDTSIHDLTDAEAADLRAVVEAMMRRGPDRPAFGIAPHGPLFAAWLDVAYPRRSPAASAELFAADFLPMALHALLRRAERATHIPNGLANAIDDVLRARQGTSGGGWPSGPYWVDERDMDALRKAYRR